MERSEKETLRQAGIRERLRLYQEQCKKQKDVTSLKKEKLEVNKLKDEYKDVNKYAGSPMNRGKKKVTASVGKLDDSLIFEFQASSTSLNKDSENEDSKSKMNGSGANYSLRPGMTRGNSFDDDDNVLQFEDDSPSPKQGRGGGGANYSMRPGLFRGQSFDDEEETITKPQSVKDREEAIAKATLAYALDQEEGVESNESSVLQPFTSIRARYLKAVKPLRPESIDISKVNAKEFKEHRIKEADKKDRYMALSKSWDEYQSSAQDKPSPKTQADEEIEEEIEETIDQIDNEWVEFVDKVVQKAQDDSEGEDDEDDLAMWIAEAKRLKAWQKAKRKAKAKQEEEYWIEEARKLKEGGHELGTAPPVEEESDDDSSSSSSGSDEEEEEIKQGNDSEAKDLEAEKEAKKAAAKAEKKAAKKAAKKEAKKAKKEAKKENKRREKEEKKPTLIDSDSESEDNSDKNKPRPSKNAKAPTRPKPPPKDVPDELSDYEPLSSSDEESESKATRKKKTTKPVKLQGQESLAVPTEARNVDGTLWKKSLKAWMNQPKKKIREQGAEIVVRVPPKTDCWRKTRHNFIMDNAPFYWQKMIGDFELIVKVRGGFGTMYDKAGLMVRRDDETWITSGMEYFNNQVNHSTCVTRDFTDWSLSPLPLNAEKAGIWFCLKRIGNSYESFYSIDSKEWIQTRQGLFTDAPVVKAGIFCACPMGTEFKVHFEFFRAQSI